MKFSFIEPAAPKAAAVVVFAHDGGVFTDGAKALDEATGGALTRAIGASRFTGKSGQSLAVLAPAGVEHARIVVLGAGDPAKLDAVATQNLGAAAYSAVASAPESAVEVVFDVEAEAADLALGMLLRSYRFDKYRTQQKAEDTPALAEVTIQSSDVKTAKKNFKDAEKVADGVFFTRDLVSEPANVLYPESFAKELKALEKLGVEVEILGEAEMEKLGCGALLGVGQGSIRESQMVVMRWNGGKKKDAPVAVVGKGVTFDTGGISIKPAGGMEDMKWDMGGAGVVAGLMKALAGRKAKANVVGVVGLVENMPDGNAQRPGDVVTSMSGQTIEVINTDAEGRLVLADALWYTKETYKPSRIIDLATLTGAIIISLGHEHAGLFSNSDELADELTAAGKAVAEPVWRLPLGAEYDKQIKSQIADMKNVGGRPAGSITAAQFLQRFVDGTDWAHIDIAGVAWSGKDRGVMPKGGTGFGVRMLDRFIADNHE